MTNIELLVFTVISIIFTLIMMFSDNIALGIISGGLSFILWFVTGLYFMYSNVTTPDATSYGLVFTLLGVVCILFTIYGSLKMLNPQHKGGILEDRS